MNRAMVFALSLVTALLAGGALQAAERQARIEVSGMSCPSCPYIAAEAIRSVASVEILEGDYDPAAQIIVFLVRFDDAVTSAEAIAEAPFDYGYPGRVLDAAES